MVVMAQQYHLHNVKSKRNQINPFSLSLILCACKTEKKFNNRSHQFSDPNLADFTCETDIFSWLVHVACCAHAHAHTHTRTHKQTII